MVRCGARLIRRVTRQVGNDDEARDRDDQRLHQSLTPAFAPLSGSSRDDRCPGCRRGGLSPAVVPPDVPPHRQQRRLVRKRSSHDNVERLHGVEPALERHRRALSREDDGGKREAKQHSWRRQAEARKALAARINHLARIARDEGRRVPGADDRFPLLRKRWDTALLLHGKVFVDECRNATGMFLRYGMPDTFVDDLRALVDAFAESRSRGWHRRRSRSAWRSSTRSPAGSEVSDRSSAQAVTVTRGYHWTCLGLRNCGRRHHEAWHGTGVVG